MDCKALECRSSSERKVFEPFVTDARSMLLSNVAESAPRCGVARKTMLLTRAASDLVDGSWLARI